MKSILPILSLFLFLTVPITGTAQNSSGDLLGVWLNPLKEGKVEFYKQGARYFGKISWLKDPTQADGKPKTDTNTPQIKLRAQHIEGLVVIKNLEWNNNDNWENGTVYDPKNGKTYSTLIKLKDINTLEITGFIGFSFIGRTETWTRVK